MMKLINFSLLLLGGAQAIKAEGTVTGETPLARRLSAQGLNTQPEPMQAGVKHPPEHLIANLKNAIINGNTAARTEAAQTVDKILELILLEEPKPKIGAMGLFNQAMGMANNLMNSMGGNGGVGMGMGMGGNGGTGMGFGMGRGGNGVGMGFGMGGGNGGTGMGFGMGRGGNGVGMGMGFGGGNGGGVGIGMGFGGRRRAEELKPEDH